MNRNDDIPVLNDLIEKGIEIKLSDLGLDQDLLIDDEKTEPELDSNPFQAEPEPQPEVEVTATESKQPLTINPELEEQIRQILDQHMEQAWQEIRLAIRDLDS